MSTNVWIPERGALVRHKPDGVLFLVQRRTKLTDADGKMLDILLWDAHASRGGRSFLLDECIETSDINLLGTVEKFSIDGREVTLSTSKREDGSVIILVASGDRVASVVLPSLEQQVLDAARSLSEFFGGSIIDTAPSGQLASQWRRAA